MKKLLLINTVLLFICLSCETPKLDGHYHLELNNGGSKFQTWNIKNNRMKINQDVCSETDSTCFTSQISFSKNVITIDPWVDIKYSSKYHIDKKGIVYLEGDEYNSPLKLVPKTNCQKSDEYFKQKLGTLVENFQMVQNNYAFDEKVFPSDYKNELIIGKTSTASFFLFNDRLLSYNSNNHSYNIPNSKKKDDLWVHIDQNRKMIDILPILKECYEKGYIIHFTTQEKSENDEQLGILKKSITNFQKKENGFVLNSCEYCEKYPNQKTDSIFKAKIISNDLCIINEKETDFFQLRNQLVRYLKRSRLTRLNTQIQLEIDQELLFKDYLELINELDFINTELLGTYYRAKDDPDQKKILQMQETRGSKNLHLEFPLRIIETFSH